MKIWLFTFMDPTFTVSSCRIRARDRREACAMGEGVLAAVSQPLTLRPDTPRPSESVLMVYFGEEPGDAPSVMSLTLRDGQILTPQAAL